MKSPKTLETPEEIIKEITDACEGKRCIFRGESKEFDNPVSSNVYRRFFVEDELREYKEESTYILEEYTRRTVENSRWHHASGVSDIDILTQLQHYGGKTTLIDFTYNLLIALFFSCDGDFKRNGKLYIYEVDKFSVIPPKESIEYVMKEKRKDSLIEPISKEPRVIFQSSVFVYAYKGFLEVDLNINIPSEQKYDILKYLRQSFNITTETIYNDIHGFIKNQNNHIDAEVELYKGMACFFRKQYDKAIRYCNEAIEINPQYTAAYTVRAATRRAQDDIEGAIRDYDKVIEIYPKDAPAYAVRGAARQMKDDLEGAIQDYNKAIEINPQYTTAYIARGAVRRAQGDIESAIQDLNKAKELAEQQGPQKLVDMIIKELYELKK